MSDRCIDHDSSPAYTNLGEEVFLDNIARLIREDSEPNNKNTQGHPASADKAEAENDPHTTLIQTLLDKLLDKLLPALHIIRTEAASDGLVEAVVKETESKNYALQKEYLKGIGLVQTSIDKSHKAVDERLGLSKKCDESFQNFVYDSLASIMKNQRALAETLGQINKRIHSSETSYDAGLGRPPDIMDSHSPSIKTRPRPTAPGTTLEISQPTVPQPGMKARQAETVSQTRSQTQTRSSTLMPNANNPAVGHSFKRDINRAAAPSTPSLKSGEVHVDEPAVLETQTWTQTRTQAHGPQSDRIENQGQEQMDNQPNQHLNNQQDQPFAHPGKYACLKNEEVHIESMYVTRNPKNPIDYRDYTVKIAQRRTPDLFDNLSEAGKRKQRRLLREEEERERKSILVCEVPNTEFEEDYELNEIRRAWPIFEEI